MIDATNAVLFDRHRILQQKSALSQTDRPLQLVLQLGPMARGFDCASVTGYATLAMKPPSHNVVGASKQLQVARRSARPQVKPSGMLIRLPPELRVEIYKLLFTGTLYAPVYFSRLNRWTIWAIRARLLDQDAVSILQTCRLFREEAAVLFQRLVTVALPANGLSLAAEIFSSTVLDITKLQHVAVLGSYSDSRLPLYLKTKCPKLETMHLKLYDNGFFWWDPLYALVGAQDKNMSQLLESPRRLDKVFLSMIRKDWLTNSRVAEIMQEVAHDSYDGPMILFSAPVILEEVRYVPLGPDCDGGVRDLLPRLVP